MSKIGKLPIELPSGVTITQEKSYLEVKGPKGTLKIDKISGIDVDVKDNVVTLSHNSIEPSMNAYWGLMRALINNAVVGVTEGFTKELELIGVGYRVEKNGQDLKFAIGYSHPVIVKAPEGITFEVEGNTQIKVLGYDKQKVGQIAAEIRAIRKPEPYKGKGIRYKDEVVKRKQGKAAKSA